jgi:hypothetical protein
MMMQALPIVPGLNLRLLVPAVHAESSQQKRMTDCNAKAADKTGDARKGS